MGVLLYAPTLSRRLGNGRIAIRPYMLRTTHTRHIITPSLGWAYSIRPYRPRRLKDVTPEADADGT
ncbi:MAG: hypothetical protein ACI4AH_08030 [Muribaculaceae bacterium]